MMQNEGIPLELVSNFLSILIIIGLFFKYYSYKKTLDVLKGLDELKEQKKLTQEDIGFIKSNLKDYKINLENDEARIKLAYPIFILIGGVLIAFLSFQEALIHLNVVVVAFIFMHVIRIHTRNILGFLQQLAKDLD